MSSEVTLSFSAKTIEDAEPKARAVLNEAKQRIGYIPNIYTMMANSPGLLETYTSADKLYRQSATLSLAEKEVVYLTISRENNCRYCMAVHSTLADVMSKVPVAVTDAVRDGKSIPDEKFSALSEFTRFMVTSRGQPGRKVVETFLDAGYSERHILDIILAIAVKTISNYSNHFFNTPLDSQFASRIWQE